MPSPGLDVLTGILAATVTPVSLQPGPVAPPPPGILAVDEGASLRLFHEQALFASSGVNIDLYPVDIGPGKRVLLSNVVGAPDAPMLAGAGWLLLQDSQKNSAVIMVDNSSSLESLHAAIIASNLQVASMITQDADGFRLVVALDQPALEHLTRGVVHYGPAESVTTPVPARFGRERSAAFLFASFDAVDGDRVALDLGWGHTSAISGALIVDVDQAEALAAGLGLPDDEGGWRSFDSYAMLDHSGETPVLVQESEVSLDGLVRLDCAGRRGVPVEEAAWFFYLDGSWERAEGNIQDAFEAFPEVDPADHNLTIIVENPEIVAP